MVKNRIFIWTAAAVILILVLALVGTRFTDSKTDISQAKKGDLLVELDASSLMDTRIDQEIKVQNVEAADVNATENLAVAQNQAKSDMDLALFHKKNDYQINVPLALRHE